MSKTHYEMLKNIKTSNYTDCNAWDSVVMNAYNLKPHFIENSLLKINLFSVKPFWGKAVISTAPYCTDGGILCNDSNLDYEIIHEIKELYSSIKPAFILLKTRYNIFNACKEFFIIDESYYTFILDISLGKEDVWKNKLNSATRNRTRKGLKNNLVVKIGDLELINDFYIVLSEGWRDLGTPIHSKTFLAEIKNCFKDRAKFIVLYYKNKPVSTALLLLCDDTIHHPFTCTLKHYKFLSVNNVLYWKIIEYGLEKGLKYFDMGRSRIDQGTFRYKMHWGAESVKLYYAYYTENAHRIPNHQSWSLKLATYCWKKIPLCLANHVGPLFIKGIL